MKYVDDIIRAITPIVLASFGGTVALLLICTPAGKDLGEAKWASAMGFAGTALGGAAGLARSGSSETNVKTKEQSGQKTTEAKTDVA